MVHATRGIIRDHFQTAFAPPSLAETGRGKEATNVTGARCLVGGKEKVNPRS